ncbi:MAG: hypothetical protein B6U85_05360 [Desulfurococcales archaeon ex4484_42]|nr:MAG: hypothetical protein B6U85_05360 [Desulfurococcales archaeon ex4484_42]
MPPKISSYMSSPVIVASKNDNLAHIRNLMIRHRVGRVVIVDGNSVVGIISKSDFVRIVYNKKRYIKPLTNIYAYEIMSSPVYAIQPSKTIKAAAYAMLKRNIGSLLVIERNGKLHGIITKMDLIRAFAEKYRGKFKVSDYMIERVPTVHTTHSLYYVISLMGESGLGKVVVVDEDRVVGVITKADIMFVNIGGLVGSTSRLIRRVSFLNKGFNNIMGIYALPLASDVMTPNPITIELNEDLALAADIMVKHRLGTLPVVNKEGRLLGLLTKDTIIKALRNV